MTAHETLIALEAHRTTLLARLDALPPARLAESPAEGAWSLAQIVDHLARIDSGFCLDGPTASPFARATSRARCAVLRSVLALPLQIPAPPGAGRVMPSAAPDYASTCGAWSARREGWRRGLAEADPEAVALRHPLLGPFVLRDALAFLLAHHRHHNAQVERTLAAVR